MLTVNPKLNTVLESFKNHNARNLTVLFLWCFFLFLCASTAHIYILGNTPPFWDNLSYQNDALEIFHYWMGGNWQRSMGAIYDSMVPAHEVSLALSYLIFGQTPLSPYRISAFLGFCSLVAVFLLAIELGASKKVAMWGVIFWSVTPNFIYQNFLQTRNDYQLAFFITLSWLLLIKSVRSRSYKLVFWSGVFAGLGVLFKASGVGYIAVGFWPLFIFYSIRVNSSLLTLMKCILIFSLGAFFAAGWHYLPNLEKIIGYYVSWGGATNWKAIQYGLSMSWKDYFFYPKNIIYLHFGLLPTLLIGSYIAIITASRILISRGRFSFSWSDNSKFQTLTFFAFSLPLVFISYQKSYASVGDIPVLGLLVALLIALVSKFSLQIIFPTWLLSLVVSIALLISIPNIPVVEKQFVVKNFEKFNVEIASFRKDFDLRGTYVINIYSHPIYNADSFRWAAFMNKNYWDVIPDKIINFSNILFPEDASKIAQKLENFPSLIFSEYSGDVINGEKFHTFNRLHDSLNKEIEKKNNFIKIRKIDLEDGKFPIYLALNRNYVRFALEQNTPDGWIKWGDSIKYYSSKPRHLIWRGTADGSISQFILANRENAKDRITFNLYKKLNGGIGEYHSDLVPSSNKLKLYTLLPIQDKLQQSSIQAIGKPAFYGVDANIINHQ